MTEQNPKFDEDDSRQTSNQKPQETGGLTARMRKTPWRGWIWAVPLAALILVAYLVIRTWLLAGPTVVVTFPNAENISPKGTAVQYKGVQVGTVEDVNLSNDKDSVIVTIGMNSSATSLLGEGTKFWVVQPSLLSGDLAGLLSGAYIKLEPPENKNAKPKYHFKGLLKSPPKMPTYPGKHVTIYAKKAGSLSRGANVLYNGVTAGQILDISYDFKREQTKFNIFVRKPFTKYLDKHTRFWRSGDLGISSGSAGMQFEIPKISNLLKGAIAFNTFSNTSSKLDYRLYNSRKQAINVLNGAAAKYYLRFYVPTDGLKSDSNVTLEGRIVGKVVSVDFKYDKDKQKMATLATIKIYANRLGIKKSSKNSNKENNTDPQIKNLKQTILNLVKNGLVANVSSSSFILGSKQVALTVSNKKPDKKVIQSLKDSIAKNKIATLPTSLGASLQSIIASVSQITDKVNNVPIENIGDNIDQTVSKLKEVGENINNLINSKKVQKSIDHLEKSLDNIQNITANSQGKISPAIKSLRQTADSITDLTKNIKQVLVGSLTKQQSAQELIAELTRTARSIRTLANYLDRHPEALLQGRSK